MKQDERCTRCGGEIFPNAGEQWPDGWIHSEPNNCYLTASARAEAAEALAAERLEDALFAEQRATDAELERDGAILAASDAERHAENAMHGLAHFRARVAELEAQLAAQQWRPVTEKPVVTMQYQVVVQHSRQQPTADHMAYYPSSGWTGTDVIFWRPIPPLPPAPQETTP